MKTINKTSDFYRHHSVDLLTEYTICESLSRLSSPYMTALDSPRPYGDLLGRFLKDREVLFPGMRICEAGGGYGSLMRGFLESWGDFVDSVVMVDLSACLLERQKRVLSPWRSKLSFVNGDMQELLPGLSDIDLTIVNEVIGDLPTWINLDPLNLPGEVARFVDRYGLDLPSDGPFNFNTGALQLVESLCKKKGGAFLSEHSSDPLVFDDMDYLLRDLERDDYPREIPLAGHSEYTIRFSHLVAVAEGLGRDVATGSLMEVVNITDSPRNRSVFLGRMTGSDEQESRYELLDNIREYRWMLIR